MAHLMTPEFFIFFCLVTLAITTLVLIAVYLAVKSKIKTYNKCYTDNLKPEYSHGHVEPHV